MFVKQVIEYDSKSNEADVIVTDGRYELLCYCHPIESKIVGFKVYEINSLFADTILRINEREFLIRKDKEYYSYYLRGKVIDHEKPIICIGELIIKLDKPLAKDISINDFIELKVDRLNCVLH